MLVPYTENDFSFRAETADEILEFLEIYEGRKIEGLRSELNKLMIRSRKTGQFYESAESGFFVGFDPQRSDYILFKKELYDPSNLFFVLFDLIVTPMEGSVDEELFFKKEAVSRYFAKASEMEGELFSPEKEEVLTLLEQMVRVTRSFDGENFTEEEMERISEAIDKTYYMPLETVFQSIVDRIAEPRINVRVDAPDYLPED